jgi:pimeloyl-ACP methyl ester carboxylesterase
VTDTPIFEPDGRAIPYVDEGHGDGPSLVLIAEPGREAVLASIAHILAGEGIRVLTLGARTNADDASRDDLIADAIAVMDHVGLRGGWIGGHGTGGTVARALTAAHRDRALGVLLLGVEEAEIEVAPAIPILIVQGADDDVTPPQNGDRFRDAMPERASVVTIADSGHLFPVTHPVETAFAIEDYLAWD